MRYGSRKKEKPSENNLHLKSNLSMILYFKFKTHIEKTIIISAFSLTAIFRSMFRQVPATERVKTTATMLKNAFC